MSTMKPEAGQWWRTATGSRVRVIGQRNGVMEWVVESSTAMWTEPLSAFSRWTLIAEPEQPQPDEDPDEWVIQDRVPVRVGVDEIHWSDWDVTRWEVASGHWFPDTRYGSTQDGAVLEVRCRRRDLPKAEQKKTTAIDARLNEPEKWPKYYVPVNAAYSLIEQKSVAYFRRDDEESGQTFHTDGTSYRFDEWTDNLVEVKQLTEAEALALIQKPEPQPQKTQVRLWISATDASVYFGESPKLRTDCEIHHDSEGFYVEGGQ